MDHLPDIPTDLSRRADSLQLTGDLVLVETNQNDTMVGSLWVPLQAISHYPTSGWIIALGPKVTEDLKVGDFVVIEEEGADVGQSYYDVFEILLKMPDGSIESIYTDIEVEPVLREQVGRYRRGAGPDSQLTAQDRKVDGGIRFNCSDVVSWQMGEIANPSYDLTYVHTHMFNLLDEDDKPVLHYIMGEGNILLTWDYE